MDQTKIKRFKNGKSLYAAEYIPKRSTILKFEKKFLDYPRRDTLTIDKKKHQYSKNPDAKENFLNHSCDPNCYIDFRNLSLKALKDINADEEITFNYLTTEWDLVEKFDCNCGSKNCYGQVRGFKYLTPKQKKQLKPSPFLKKIHGNSVLPTRKGSTTK